MTLPRKTRRFFPAALILAGAGLAAACTTASVAQDTATAPFACQIAVEDTGRATSFRGLVQASESLSGSYSLHLTGRGTNIRQGGGFSARAGETVTLGQSMLSGDAADYTAELTLTVNGATYSCQAVDTDA